MSEKVRIFLKKPNAENAKFPVQGKVGDAAFDVFCTEDFELEPGETKTIDTGLQIANIEFFDSWNGKDLDFWGFSLYLQVLARSGLAAQADVIPIGGVIDKIYRGNIKIILHHLYNPKRLQSCKFTAGSKIAQIAILKNITNVEFVETETVTETVRGNNGFGSTDKKE